MTKLLRICLLLCFGLLCAACASLIAPPAPAQAGVNAAPGRQILVTFADERVGRVPVANPANGYRERGSYGNSSWSERVAEQLAEDYGLRSTAQWPINALGIHCVVYEIQPGQIPEQVLDRLAQDKRIEAVQFMQTFQVMAASYSDPYFKLQTGLQALHIESAHRVATGRNIKIAVIDTGVDAKHPDLDGQIALEKNFVAGSPGKLDLHGTAVAGIIAAIANNQQGIVGIAPDAKLLALKACWPTGPLKPEATCDSLTLSLALNEAISQKADIINLSLIGPNDPLVERLVNKALDDGIIVVASSQQTKDGETAFPSSIARVIAVRSAADAIDSASGIAAPGQEILTTLPSGGYNFMSGSSFAAAHVSGLIALLLELKPKLGSAQIAALLRWSMAPMPNTDSVNTVNICAALANASGNPDCGSPSAKNKAMTLKTAVEMQKSRSC
jgi:hypothetical protein